MEEKDKTVTKPPIYIYAAEDADVFFYSLSFGLMDNSKGTVSKISSIIILRADCSK